MSGGHKADGSEESDKVKVACAPCMPTQEEVTLPNTTQHVYALHNTTHYPFRSWCKFCVAGKAKANPHFKKDSDRVQSENIVSLDYAFLGDRENESDADDECDVADHRDRSGNLKVLVARDHKSKYVFANVVPRKGDHPYVVHREGEDLTSILGYKRVILIIPAKYPPRA